MSCNCGASKKPRALSVVRAAIERIRLKTKTALNPFLEHGHWASGVDVLPRKFLAKGEKKNKNNSVGRSSSVFAIQSRVSYAGAASGQNPVLLLEHVVHDLMLCSCIYIDSGG